jgi:hypothetical protein
VTYPSSGALATAAKRHTALTLRVRCNFDCRYTIGLFQLGHRQAAVTRVGTVLGGKPTVVKLLPHRLRRGRYRFQGTFVAPVNPGGVTRSSSRILSVR